MQPHLDVSLFISANYIIWMVIIDVLSMRSVKRVYLFKKKKIECSFNTKAFVFPSLAITNILRIRHFNKSFYKFKKLLLKIMTAVALAVSREYSLFAFC